MSRSHLVKFTLLAVLCTLAAYAQINPASTNNLPNPFHLVDWAKLPAGIEWGQVISVEPDSHGNIWVFHRKEPNILEFDASGKLIKSFGTGFVQAHGLGLDRDGNIWVTDGQGKDGKGQQAIKFSPEGKVLMTLGKAGMAGSGPDMFNSPSDVVVAPNGYIFIADGHGGNDNERIVKFSKDGKYITSWGRKGSGPGEFDSPHSMAMDSKGRLFVADRSNNRIEIFDQDGKFLDQWKQFGRPSGIYISKDDTLYSVDSQSDDKTNPGVKRGIRIGSAKDGSVKWFIPDPNDPNANPQVALAEGVASDSKGDVYAAGVSSTALRKFARK